jgi:hypothetical protein
MARLFYAAHDSLLRRPSPTQYARFTVDLSDIVMGHLGRDSVVVQLYCLTPITVIQVRLTRDHCELN